MCSVFKVSNMGKTHSFMIIGSILMLLASSSAFCMYSENGVTYLNGYRLDRGDHQITSATDKRGRPNYRVITTKSNGKITVKTYRDDETTGCEEQMYAEELMDKINQDICSGFPKWMKLTMGC